jgi:hypothetical protein
MATTPHLVAVVLCDQVIEDIRTRKKTYVGVFSNIQAQKFPAQHPEMSIAVTLTECRGKQEMILQILLNEDQGEKEILKIEGIIQSDDPLAMIDLIFQLRGIPIPKAGKYTIKLSSKDTKEVIGYRHFQVAQLQKKGG